MQQAEPIAVFSSQSRGLMLAFSPEDGFIGKDHKGEAAPAKNLVFTNGVLRAMTQETADMLRRHKGNVANGGDKFEEVPQGALRASRTLANGHEAEMPEGGLTTGDLLLLRELEAASKHITPKAIPKACVKAVNAIARFKVWGLKPPEEGMPVSSITARIRVILDKLNEAGIRYQEEQGMKA